MYFSLHTNKTDLGFEPAFYIQNKGNNAGKPLKEPIPNCFAVNTIHPLLYWIVYYLFVSDLFQPVITGSVVPFITKNNIENVIDTGLINIYGTKETVLLIEIT